MGKLLQSPLFVHIAAAKTLVLRPIAMITLDKVIEKMEKELFNFIKEQKYLRPVLTALTRLCPLLLGLLYGFGGLHLLKERRYKTAVFYALPPAVTHLSAGVLRRALNRPRPFEDWEEEPLVPHKGGCSFPSRHSADGAAMACALARVFPKTAKPAWVLTLLTGLCRIPCGLHYVRDVAAGLLFGTVLGKLTGCVKKR